MSRPLSSSMTDTSDASTLESLRRDVEPGGASRIERLREFLLLLHRDTELRRTSYTFVTELRRLTQCDRVILMLRRRSTPRVVAVSNLPVVDPRSTIVREAERLARSWGDDEPAWYVEGEVIASDAETVLRPFLDESHSRALAILPLRTANEDSRPTQWIATVICERFERLAFDDSTRRELLDYCQHGSLALGNSLEISRLPFIGIVRWMHRLRAQLRSARVTGRIIVSLVVLAALVVFAVWPVNDTVSVMGTLQPEGRREIFAPADGVVIELYVKQGDRITPGQRLLAIRNEELDFELTRIFGELQTARQRLVTLQAARLETGTTRTATTDASQIAAEEEQLKELIRGLEAQHAHRTRQRDELTIVSPIEGEVLTWELERTLRERPVKRGQRLMTVADIASGWEVEMHVADGDVGRVMRARRDAQQPLSVSFRMASDPGRVFSAQLARVSDWVEVDRSGKPAVTMTATINDADIQEIRPGTSAAAKIHLGQRARAFVWFHDVIEFLRVRLWLF